MSKCGAIAAVSLLNCSFLIPSYSIAQVAPAEIVDVTAAEVGEPKQTKITDRRHPDFVRCRLEPVVGHLAKRLRVCMTNREWKRALRQSNRDARQFVKDNETLGG